MRLAVVAVVAALVIGGVIVWSMQIRSENRRLRAEIEAENSRLSRAQPVQAQRSPEVVATVSPPASAQPYGIREFADRGAGGGAEKRSDAERPAATRKGRVGILSARPRTPIFNSAEEYDLASDITDSGLRLAEAQTNAGHYTEAERTLKEGGNIVVQRKKVTACEPYAGTRVSIGARVETKKFRGYEVVVLEGPETKCNGVVLDTTVKIDER